MKNESKTLYMANSVGHAVGSKDFGYTSSIIEDETITWN